MRLEGKDGFQPPKFFLDITHKNGVYSALIEEIAHVISQTKDKKSINISAYDFEDETHFLRLLATYKDTNTIFELQSDIYKNYIAYEKKIQKIKIYDIEICLDNVKNFEDLQYFDETLVDYIKVDGDIVRLLALHSKEYDKCLQILQKAKSLNAKTIASHINSESSFRTASQLRFDYFQGFYFGKPSSTS